VRARTVQVLEEIQEADRLCAGRITCGAVVAPISAES
jgi:hypothetical protein